MSTVTEQGTGRVRFEPKPSDEETNYNLLYKLKHVLTLSIRYLATDRVKIT